MFIIGLCNNWIHYYSLGFCWQVRPWHQRSMHASMVVVLTRPMLIVFSSVVLVIPRPLLIYGCRRSHTNGYCWWQYSPGQVVVPGSLSHTRCHAGPFFSSNRRDWSDGGDGMTRTTTTTLYSWQFVGPIFLGLSFPRW